MGEENWLHLLLTHRLLAVLLHLTPTADSGDADIAPSSALIAQK